MNELVKGIVPPLITPLDDDGNIDFESYSNVINHLIDAGVDGVFALGSTGEAVFLTDEQRIEVVRHTLDVVAGRVPVMVGAIEMQSARVIDFLNNLKSSIASDFNKITGIVVTAPFYALEGIDNIEQHFVDINNAFPDVQLWAYDIPVCVHTKLDTDMLIKLGKSGVLSGVKDSSGDDVSFRCLIVKNQEAGHPLQLLTGHELVVDGCFLGGADGCVPGLANVDPKIYCDMYSASIEGDWDRVRQLQDRTVKLFEIVMIPKAVSGFSAGAGSFKAALHIMGIIKSHNITSPAKIIQGKDYENIKSILKREGVI